MSDPGKWPWMNGVHPGPPAMHFMERPGPGATLLLLHGVTRCWRDWEPLFPDLPPAWRIVALDHCGHGSSARTPGAYRVLDHARRSVEFIQAVRRPAPLIVFGHSLGAMVALYLAAVCPNRIAGIILEDPPFHTMGRDIAASPWQAQFAGMRAVARRGGDLETIVAGLADILLPGPKGEIRFGDTRDRASLLFSAECLAQADPEILTPLVEGTWLDGFDYESLWPKVKCPLLLLQSDPRHGGALTDEDAALATRQAAQCRHVRFEAAGHQLHRTHPTQVLASLHQWAEDGDLLD